MKKSEAKVDVTEMHMCRRMPELLERLHYKNKKSINNCNTRK